MPSAALLLLAVLASTPAPGAEPRDADDEAPQDVPSRLDAPPLASATPLRPEDDLLALATLTPKQRLVATFHGAPEELTIDVALQRELTELLETYQVPWGAVVVMEPSTGRVLAMAEHSEEQPELTGLCTKALYPAASLFKVVTAKALLEVGVSPDEVECVHGGMRRLTPSLLEPSPSDGRCLTLAEAMGAVRQRGLRAVDGAGARSPRAPRLGEGAALQPAPAVPGADRAVAGQGAERDLRARGRPARASATCTSRRCTARRWRRPSPTGGLWRTPVLFESEVAKVAARSGCSSPKDAAALVEMLAKTVHEGTGRRIFHERDVALPDAAGKTGSLSDKRPFRDYSWFVGFAPVESPKVAVAAVMVNDPVLAHSRRPGWAARRCGCTSSRQRAAARWRARRGGETRGAPPGAAQPRTAPPRPKRRPALRV